MQVFVQWVITDTIMFDLTVKMFYQYGLGGNTKFNRILFSDCGEEQEG
jgi:hypothetical protein